MRQTTLTRANNHTTNSAIIARLCSQTSETITGEIVYLLANTPDCLQSFWSSIEPAFTSCYVRSAADELRNAAALEVKNSVRLPNHLQWLYEQGHSHEDTRQIRYVIEAFYNAEPMFAILAALAMKWLECSDIQSDIVHSECDWNGTHPTFITPIYLSGENGGIPFGTHIHKFHKALNAWPCYARKVSNDFVNHKNALEDSSVRLIQLLEKLTDNMPMGVYDNVQIADRKELNESARRCIKTSCEVILLTSSLRRMFIKAETEARVKRVTSNAH